MYKEVISPILDHLPSEEMHILVRDSLHLFESTPSTLKLLEFIFAYRRKRFSSERLKVTLPGIPLDNPVMVAAGWDKKGVAVRALHQLGASAVEVGTVLPKPQPGNPKPRQFVADGKVALNRLGFNSPGEQVVWENLQRYKNDNIPIGISLGKNKDTKPVNAPLDHALVAYNLYHEASYFVINVSSPNTPGLRELQDKGPLTEIVEAVNEEMDEYKYRKPLFVKIAPDLTLEAVDDVIEVAITHGLTGIIAANTTINQQLKASYGWENEMGGLSGDNETFRRMSTRQVAHIKTSAPQLSIIGVGGVRDGSTAWEKIAAGANAVQVMTALRAEGLSIFGKINSELVSLMDQRGVKRISDIVGQDAHKFLS